jgi:diaminopimelate decarboxylase
MNDSYRYEAGELLVDDVPLRRVAEEQGTPAYVYSASMIRERYRAYDAALAGLPHQVCYAVKANSNLSVLRILAELGAGFDIVSGGELFRVLKAGGDPAKVVFSGVGKTPEEIRFALEQGILAFNCESYAEIDVLDRVAGECGLRAQVALRVNPDVNPATHEYISTGMRENKFGIDSSLIDAAYDYAHSRANLLVNGVSCHIGSQMLDHAPMVEAVEKVLALADGLRVRGIPVDHLDLGGGLGVAYEAGQSTPEIGQAIAAMRKVVEGRGYLIVVEPGRSVVAEAGVLLARVLYCKQNGAKEFVIVDAAMNDLIRPSLYKAHHEIVPVRLRDAGTMTADIVGPVCESGDFLAKNRTMPRLEAGDLIAIRTAGAYGFGMASNYNSRPRAAEVMVDGGELIVARRRESLDDLIRGELC